MSFYAFNKAKGFANTSLLRKLECSICPLGKIHNEHPKILPEGATGNVDVYVLGLGPGPDEDKIGHFWVGNAGQFLRSCFTQEQWQHIRYNNVTRCREPENKPPIEAITCCAPSIEKDIEAFKPRAIFAMGAPAARWCLQIDYNIAISIWRGTRFPFKIGNHVCWVFPMFHPSYLLRGAGHLVPVFKHDIRNAYNFLHQRKTPVVYDRNRAVDKVEIVKTIPNLKLGFKKIEEEYKKSGIAAVDFETNRKRPYYLDSKILTASVGTPEYAMAWPMWHRQARWSAAELQEIVTLLIEFLLKTYIKKVAHNLTFELEWSCVKLSRKLLRTNWVDTLASAYMLGYGGQSKKKADTEVTEGASTGDEAFHGLLGLDEQVKLYFGFFLKSLFNLNMLNLDNEDLNELCVYNGGDTIWDAKLNLEHEQEIRELGLYDEYLDQCRRIPTLCSTQIVGLPYNRDRAQELFDKYGRKKLMVFNGVHKHPAILEYKSHHKFDVGSPEDVATFFRDLGYDMTVTDKQTGRVSLSSDAEHLEKIDHVLARSVLDYRELDKSQTTYLRPVLDPNYKAFIVFPDGLLHTELTSLFTTTNRVSSRNPNSQNWPSHGNKKEVKSIIVPPLLYIVAKNDYGQLEFRVMAMASKDKKLVKYIWDGYDVHADWARRWATKCPELIYRFLAENSFNELLSHKLGSLLQFQPKTPEAIAFKGWRDVIKNNFVFAKFYGAADKSIGTYLRAPYEVAKEIGTEFWEEFNGYKEYQDKTVHDYEKNGYITLLTGLRRYAPIDHGQIINTPIQGSACAIVMWAMNVISEYAEESGQLHLQPRLNVHDDLTFFLPESSWETDQKYIIKQMIMVPYEWINVPLVVESEIGPNLAETHSYGVFSSANLASLN